MQTNAKTHNGANAYEHSENLYLEFFSKAGSMMEKRQTYYHEKNPQTALSLFKDAWRAGDNILCMQMLMYLRDIRQGQGNRSGFRSIINWLACNYPDWISANIELIPQIGRWDDLKSLYGTNCEIAALTLWAKGLNNPETSGLAAKWADRQDGKLRNFVKMSPKSFRKMLVAKTNVVETLMCNKQWGYIDYNKTPSVAATRYNTAFLRNDEERYLSWKTSLADKKSGNKVNAGAIFPHDLVRTAKYSQESNDLLEAQLKAMNNFIPENQRIMCITDFSGSMESVNVSGSVTAMDISLALGLYCSEKVGANNPFYHRFIPFSSKAKLVSWRNMNFVQAVQKIPDGYVGSTNIHSAFESLLEAAEFFGVTKDQMPTTLLILSDMAFDRGGISDKTPVEDCIEKWISKGYNKPQIVYWNLGDLSGQPATCFDKDICLISGFSPAILKSVLGGDDLSPMGVLRRAVSIYKINRPV
jgi:hypothetical protein